jgi:hypothetical protein
MCGPPDFAALMLSMTRIGYAAVFLVGVSLASRYLAGRDLSFSSLVSALKRRILRIPAPE